MGPNMYKWIATRILTMMAVSIAWAVANIIGYILEVILDE